MPPHSARPPRVAIAARVCAAIAVLVFARGVATAAVDADAVRRVLTLIDAVVEEYREGVQQGAIARPVEYEEARVFVSEAKERAGRIGLTPVIGADLGRMAELIEGRAQLADVRAVSDQIRQAVVAATGVSNEVFPAQAPSAARGRLLFAENCVPCHGSAADGKGVRAAELNPPPANFTNAEFMRGETPYDFFQVISVGKPPSAMPAWGEVFSVQERWDLVSYLWTVPLGRDGLAEGQGVYLAHCASCHGATGDGKGAYSAGLITPAKDLSTPTELARKSDADLSAVVAGGVGQSAMPRFDRLLSDDERTRAVGFMRLLSLGGDIGSGSGPGIGEGGGRRLAGLLRLLADEYGRAVAADGTVNDLEYNEARILLSQVQERAAVVSNELAAQSTDDASQLRTRIDEMARTIDAKGDSALVASLAGAAGNTIAAHLSPSGDSAAGAPVDAVAATRRGLAEALTAYKVGDVRARDLVSDAYFEFEPLEKKLASTAPELTRTVEGRFLELRGVVAKAGAEAPVAGLVRAINGDLDAVESALKPAVNPYVLATQSAFIILREGFEVVLIIGALLTFATKSGNAAMRRPIVSGTLAGIAMSLATAYVLSRVLSAAGGVTGDTLEGITMLLAALVLFWVSYWLVSKAEADKWQQYIRGKMQNALSTGSRLALAGTAFLAVYREGVETVLFYQVLIATDAGNIAPVFAGIAAGCVALAGLYAAFVYFGRRLPLQQFFLATSVLLYYLAIVCAGKGVFELQEAGWLSTTAIGWLPRIEFIGLYPTLETVLAQGLLVALLVYAIVVTVRARSPRADAAEPLLQEVRALHQVALEIRAALVQTERDPRLATDLEGRIETLIGGVADVQSQLHLRLPNGPRKH